MSDRGGIAISAAKKKEKGLYNAELVAGSLLIPESRKVAQLLLDQSDQVSWHRAIILDNILQKKSPASAKRQAKLIKNRLSLMKPDLWRLIVDGSSEETTQALFAAAVKHSRLLGDFVIRILKPRLLSFDNQLLQRDWGKFIEGCEQLDPEVGTWAESTRNKLGQVVFRILAEARYIESTKSLKITPVKLAPQVRSYLVDHKEECVLNCMEVSK